MTKTKLTAAQRLLLRTVEDMTLRYGRCITSYKKLADDVGVARSTIIRAAGALQKADLLRTEKVDGCAVNVFISTEQQKKGVSFSDSAVSFSDSAVSFSDSSVSFSDSRAAEIGVSKSDSSVSKSDSGVSKSDTIYIYNIYTNTYITKDEAFAIFWDAYDKKLSIGQARSTWKKVWQRLTKDETLFETIIEAAKADKQNSLKRVDGDKYRKHPSTWLNAEAWLDELQWTESKALDAVDEALQLCIERGWYVPEGGEI